MKNIPRWLDGYKIKNRIRAFEAAKSKVAKHRLPKERLNDTDLFLNTKC